MGDEKGGDVVAVGGGDGGEEGLQCKEHPYRSNPGGICAFCLQEKLGKLVSSSNSNTPFFPLHPPPSSNNSSPPSFRSVNNSSGSASTSTAVPSATSRNGHGRTIRPSKIPSFLVRPSSNHQYIKKDQPPLKPSSSSIINTNTILSSANSLAAPPLNVKPSKSVVPKPTGDKNMVAPPTLTMDSPRKKSFWSFLYLSSSSSSSDSTSASAQPIGAAGSTFGTTNAALRRRSVSSYSSSRGQGTHHDLPHLGSIADHKSEEDETVSPGGGSQSQGSSSSFGRKVARSRSVGCGSRSFSGDFLERLSNGFGDCTLRRVESHRESNNKPNKMGIHGHMDDGEETELEQRMRRIKCSGFFSSSYASSSSYWLSADQSGARMSTGGGGRSNRSWGWAFASPMRAFKPTTTSSSSSIKSMPSTITAIPPPISSS